MKKEPKTSLHHQCSHAFRPSGLSSMGGFTLLELMLVVTLMGVFLTIGVPAFGSLVANNAVTSAANDLVASLNRARNEAVTRGGGVRVCPRSGSDDCGGSDWSAGWVVVPNGSVGSPSEIKRLQRVSVNSPASELAFTARGFLEGSAACFAIEAPAASRHVSVRISRFGVAEAAQGGCS